METLHATVVANATPPPHTATGAEVVSRALQAVCNLVFNGLKPDEPMFAFTDDFFNEFPVSSRDTSRFDGPGFDVSRGFDVLPWLCEGTRLSNGPVPTLTPQRLSAVSAAWLGLAAPGLGSALGSISQQHSGASACGMFCFPVADAGLLPHRRVPWQPNRHGALAAADVRPSGSHSATGTFASLPAARRLPSAPGAPTFLVDASTWNDDVVSRLAQDQLKHFMGALPRDLWHVYLRVRTDIRVATAAISRHFETHVASWEAECVSAINTAINAKIGSQAEGPVDCRLTWLHTDYLEVPSRSPRALAEGQPVAKRRSLTLWDAARQGFSYAVAWDFGDGGDFAAASFISRDEAGRSLVNGLDVAAFAAMVRTIDPGARASRIVDELVTQRSAAWHRLYELQANTLTFDIMDASRSPATTGVDASAREHLLNGTIATKGNRDWRRYRAQCGITSPLLGIGQWVQLPFFSYEVDGVGVVAHAMGYPDFPLRVFPARDKADAWLEATADLSAPWLHAQLSGDDRERVVALRRALAEADQPLTGLNPVAALLHDTATALFPAPGIELVVDTTGMLVNERGVSFPWKLPSPANSYAQSRIAANAARLATPSGELDWAYARDAGWRTAAEILEILVTPAPGGMAGLKRMRTMAFGGFIGMGLAQGAIDGSRGDPAPAAGVATDILDLAFGLITGRLAARVVLRQAGYRRVPLANLADGLWRFDADAMVRPHPLMVDGQQPGNDGVIHVLGHTFVRLEQPSGPAIVLAASKGSDGGWRLRPRDGAGYAPAIRRSGDQWALDLDDTPRDDAGLLSRTFSIGGLSATEGSHVRLQEITGVTRAELDSIWRGEAPPTWLDGAAVRVAIDDIVNRFRSTHPGHGEPLHAIGEALYAQFLADTLLKRVHVVDDNGVTAYLLDPQTGAVTDKDELTLHRQPGGSYGAQRQSKHGERVGIPGMLDVALAQQPTLGTFRVPLPAASVLPMRRHLVNTASDAWVVRHARAIERACLCAFDLETPRQPKAFLAAGQAGAAQRVPALDARDRATIAQLQFRYPGLTRADAIAALADQTLGPLARGEPDADALASVLGDLRMFSRVVAARFRALTEHYDADSEALLLTGLTAHPAWPADRFIEVFQGGTDPETGDVINHGVSVARFGRGSQPLNLVRTAVGLHRVANLEGKMAVVTRQVGAPALSLVSRVVQALSDDGGLPLASLAALTPSSIVASMDMPATLKALTDAAAHGIRATTPLGDSYVTATSPDDFPDDPVGGYYKSVKEGETRHFVEVDGLMVQAVRELDGRACLLPRNDPSDADSPGAQARLDRHGHWRLIRLEGAVQRDLAEWEGAGGGFSDPSTLLLPLDGIRSTKVAGGTWRELVVAGKRLKVTYDFDFQAWRGIDNPGRVFRRVQGSWQEGAATGELDTPTQFATIQVPSMPVPPTDATPLPKTIGYGWTGPAPSATTLAKLIYNADATHSGDGGWTTHLHLDLDDAAQASALKSTLAPRHIEVNDLRRDPAFIAWLATPAGRLYTAARDGTQPCYAGAMDVLRFGWILKRHGGLYVDMDDVILDTWPHDLPLQAGPFQLLSGGPVTQELLGLDWDINTSHLGSHAHNPLLDRIVETMVERAARKPDFFNEALPDNAKVFGRALSALTGPGVLKDVLEQHAPEVSGIVAAMRVLKGNDIRHEALELAVAEAKDSYFPLADLIDPGHDNSWARSDD